MTWQEDALKRIDDLIQEGEAIPGGSDSRGRGGFIGVESASFAGWRTKTVAALIALIGSEHTYTVEFSKKV
jgi:hypothetical protein